MGLGDFVGMHWVAAADAPGTDAENDAVAPAAPSNVAVSISPATSATTFVARLSALACVRIGVEDDMLSLLHAATPTMTTAAPASARKRWTVRIGSSSSCDLGRQTRCALLPGYDAPRHAVLSNLRTDVDLPLLVLLLELHLRGADHRGTARHQNAFALGADLRRRRRRARPRDLAKRETRGVVIAMIAGIAVAKRVLIDEYLRAALEEERAVRIERRVDRLRAIDHALELGLDDARIVFVDVGPGRDPDRDAEDLEAAVGRDADLRHGAVAAARVDEIRLRDVDAQLGMAALDAAQHDVGRGERVGRAERDRIRRSALDSDAEQHLRARGERRVDGVDELLERAGGVADRECAAVCERYLEAGLERERAGVTCRVERERGDAAPHALRIVDLLAVLDVHRSEEHTSELQ